MNLFNSDCLEAMKDIPEKSVDMVLCDLPYGITSNAWDTIIPLKPLWDHYLRITKDVSAIVLNCSNPFSSILLTSNIPMFKHEWIWIKNAGSNFANTCREPMKEHESVLVFSKGKWKYNKQMQERAESGKSRIKTPVKFETASDNYRKFEHIETKTMPELRVPSSWQKFNRERGLHPTQKPVMLCEYLIKTYTDEMDTVLDNCMGSGTTGVACINTNRNFIGIEIDKTYYDIAVNRINDTQNNRRQ